MGSRKRCALFCLLALLAACAAPPGEDHEAMVEGYLQTFLVERNWAQWPAYFDSSASLNGSGFALQIMRGTAEGLHFSFPDMTLEVLEQISDSDRVVTLFVIRGTHEQSFDGQPATHRPVELEGFVLDRFENGRIIDSKMLLDVWGLSRRVAGFGVQGDGN